MAFLSPVCLSERWPAPPLKSGFHHIFSVSGGQILVSGCRDKTIKLWDLQSGDLLRTLSGHTEQVNSVAISPDGQTLVSGSLD